MSVFYPQNPVGQLTLRNENQLLEGISCAYLSQVSSEGKLAQQHRSNVTVMLWLEYLRFNHFF